MTKEEHRQRHVELHRALYELFADFFSHHHKDRSNFLDMSLSELIFWSHKQTIEPDELKTETGEPK